MSFNIIGTGRALPSFVVTNDMLSQLVDTSDEWIKSRTGIRERHIVTDETLCGLAVKSSADALAKSGISPDKLDLIICATIQSDDITPSLSCMVQQQLGANCPAFDVNAACTGFLYSLDVAASYFDSGKAENILVVAGEVLSKHLDWNDRATCVLFGDGAGAVVLQKGDGLLSISLEAKGNNTYLRIPGVNGTNPYRKTPDSKPGLFMNGGEVFKFAVTAMCNNIRAVLEKTSLKISDIKRFIPHQANSRIINSAVKTLGLSKSQVAIGVDRYGNTSSSSIPILLSELYDSGELAKGDIIVLSAFGGGLTSAACAIKI